MFQWHHPAVASGSSERLLAVEHEEGIAKVSRDADGSYWLSAGGEHGGSQMTERRFGFEGLRDAWVQAGLLPAAATRVRARDAHGTWVEAAAGNGVWLAITRARPLAVRFEDASGGIVPRPLDALESEPATDAAAPCVACGAAGWDRALLTPVHPSDSEDHAVVCRRCGHQVQTGSWYASPGDGSEMDPQPPDDWWRERADTMRHVFAAARFRVYGLAAWDGKRSWRGHGHASTASIRSCSATRPRPCRHGDGLREAPREPRTPARASTRAARGPGDRLSPAALTVQMEQDQLRAGKRVGAVVLHDLTIPVDGRLLTFLAGRCSEAWAAHATLNERDDGRRLTLLLTAEDVAPQDVALVQVSDIAPYLESRPG